MQGHQELEKYQTFLLNLGKENVPANDDCNINLPKEFIETGMGKSFNYAKKEYSSSVFDTVLNDDKLDMTYEPYWHNDSLFVSEVWQYESNF